MIEKNPSEAYECGNSSCHARTYSLMSDNPQERWVDVQVFSDAHGQVQLATSETPLTQVFVLHFCPRCVREHMGIDIETYESIQKTEKYVTDYVRVVQD